MPLPCVWLLEDGQRCGKPSVDGRNCGAHRGERQAMRQAAAQAGQLRWAARPAPAGRPAPNPWRGNSGWREISAAYRRAHPFCEWPGCDRPVDVVHHKDGSGRRGNRANNSDANLQSLCFEHHGAAHHRMRHAGALDR